jgi:hypothetical protein
MLINRHNYEEFFLLYVDNELSVAERKAVEAFVAENPDLEEELVMMMQSVLRPDKNIVFADKESLLKSRSANGLVNESNCEEYFVLYGDNELTNEEKHLVEQFVQNHPQYQAGFELIQQARLIPEQSIGYPDKNELYRSEGDHKVIPVRWWKMVAAAAVVLLFLGVAGWYLTTSSTGGNAGTKTGLADGKNTPKTNNQNPALPAPANNNSDQVAAVDEKNNAVNEALPAVDEQKNLAAIREEKNIRKKSNIPVYTIVTPKSNDERMVVNLPKEDPVVERQRTKHEIAIANVPEAPIKTAEALTASLEPGGMALNNTKQTVIYIDSTSTADEMASLGKKPVRHLLQKVKGFFDTNEENDANDKKGIRIAAFEIALK